MKIIALTDYKGRFGSKHFDMPYRSGMDRELLSRCFKERGIDLEFKKIADIVFNEANPTHQAYIYTSSEDINYYYKSYIEDAVLALQASGSLLVPEYKYLRANNNKVFMEMLRATTKDPKVNSIRSFPLGSREEVIGKIKEMHFPIVIKTAEGASGSGVFLANDERELIEKVDMVSSSKSIFSDIKDSLRRFKHKGYRQDSIHRKKYVVQEFIPGLKNDWKVYCFWEKYYIFFRPIFKSRGFRASGGGYDNYIYGEDAPRPEGIFDFCKHVMEVFDVPNASLDIAYDGEKFHLLEIQFLYFGTAGIPYSSGFYMFKDKKWIFVKEKMSIEDVYAASISNYLKEKLPGTK